MTVADELRKLGIEQLTSKLVDKADKIERLYKVLPFRRKEKITLDEDVEVIFLCSQFLESKLKPFRYSYGQEMGNLTVEDMNDVVEILSSIQIACHTASDHMADEHDEENLLKFNRTVFKPLREKLGDFKQYAADLQRMKFQ